MRPDLPPHASSVVRTIRNVVGFETVPDQRLAPALINQPFQMLIDDDVTSTGASEAQTLTPASEVMTAVHEDQMLDVTSPSSASADADSSAMAIDSSLDD